MRYIVGFMMIAFFLVGLGLFVAGLRDLLRRIENRRRLRPAEGEIIRIERRQKIMDTESGRTAEYHFPEIKFRNEWGHEITFISEIGAGARASRYVVGQKIAILYDPDGRIHAMIDSWAGLWAPPLIQMIAGPVFISGALLIYWAFGDRILGR